MFLQLFSFTYIWSFPPNHVIFCLPFAIITFQLFDSLVPNLSLCSCPPRWIIRCLHSIAILVCAEFVCPSCVFIVIIILLNQNTQEVKNELFFNVDRKKSCANFRKTAFFFVFISVCLSVCLSVALLKVTYADNLHIVLLCPH